MSAQQQTYIKKNIRGNWEAVTEIPYDTTPEGKQRIIRLYTSKSSSGALYTSASIQVLDRGMMSHMMFQDYSKTIEQSRERCTSKAVEAQHAAVLAKLDDIKRAVKEWYDTHK